MDESGIVDMLATGYAICRASAVDNSATLFSLFLAGLAGSGAHCIGMCGPLVVSQVSSRLEGIPASSMSELSRLRGAALVPYHLGRMTTYAALGGMAAFLSGGVIQFSGLRYLAAFLLFVAGFFFLAYAARSLGLAIPGTSSSTKQGTLAQGLNRVARPLFNKPMGWRGYMLGLFLGFLPCGLLYGALAAAASTTDAIAGIFTMMAFAAGTVPALLVMGFAGHVAIVRWKALMVWGAPVLLIVNGGFLFTMAWRLAG